MVLDVGRELPEQLIEALEETEHRHAARVAREAAEVALRKLKRVDDVNDDSRILARVTVVVAARVVDVISVAVIGRVRRRRGADVVGAGAVLRVRVPLVLLVLHLLVLVLVGLLVRRRHSSKTQSAARPTQTASECV